MAQKKTPYDLLVEIIDTYLADGTIGLAALEALVDDLETRIGTPAAGTVAGDVESIETKVGTNADGAGTTTLFARLRQIVDTYLADGTHGLAQLRTDIAAIPTAMRGTDNAALASVASEARLAELDAANLPTNIDNILGSVLSILVDYLAHGTWGSAAIRAALQLVQTDTFNIHNNVLSAINDYLAHGTWGLAVTKAQLAAVKTDTFNIHNNVLSVLQDYLIKMQSNLVRWGQVYAVNGNAFTSPHLTGLGIDAMPTGWYVYVIQADNAAPEGEYRALTDYADNGTVSHDAFSVALEVGDRVLLLHPSIAAIGERADAAAAGAVTTTDTMMAYIKQLVTAAIAEAASTGRVLCSMDFWSLPQEEVAITDTAGDKALPSVTVADLPGTATIVRAIAMFKFRMVENHTYAGANALNGAQEIQVAGSVDAINFVDTQFTLAQDTREGGDVIIGVINIATTVNANGAYAFHWDLADAQQDGIKFNDVQVGLRIWYSV